MADFLSGVLWRYEPAAAPERITSNGEPRDLAAEGNRVYVGADGPRLSGVVSTYDAVTGVRGDSIDLLACAMASGEGVVWAAGCPFVQRLSTDERPLRILRQRFLPFRSPATVENSRIQFRELGIGAGSLWVLGDALDRRLWRLDSRTGGSRRRSGSASRRPRLRSPMAPPGLPTGCTIASSPSTRPTTGCCRRSRSATERVGSPRAGAASGSRTRSRGRSRGSIRAAGG